MKHFVFLIAFSLAASSCSYQHAEEKSSIADRSETANDELTAKRKKPELEDASATTFHYKKLDTVVRKDIEALDKVFPSTPFFTQVEGKTFYVVCTGRYEHGMEEFGGVLKYGLVDQSYHLVLDTLFDIIHNPNQVIKNCFEITRNGRVGLFNYKTGQLLEPQFDYVFPSSESPTSIAYGYKLGQWHLIDQSNLLEVEIAPFDPRIVMQDLSFSIESVGDNMMYDSYWVYFHDDANVGNGAILTPSYLSFLNIAEPAYTDIMPQDEDQNFDFGTEHLRVQTTQRRSLSDVLHAFFVSFYEEGIEGRGYHIESQKLILHHSQTEQINTLQMGALTEAQYFCREASYKFVNDSILEVKANRSNNEKKRNRYSFESMFTYYQISENGTIEQLKSNRYYDATKFIFMDERHFEGCFAWKMDSEEYSSAHNMWMADHLKVEDLDIMRNEIFAEYGYRFKTQKWKNYFSSQPWYKPTRDDVTHLLSEMDRANVKLILKVKEQMLKEEDVFINKRPTSYYLAG